MYIFTVLRATVNTRQDFWHFFWHIFDKFDDRRDIGGKAIDLLCRFSFNFNFFL